MADEKNETKKEETTTEETPWPNQQEVIEGLVPVEDVPQDPALFNEDDEDLEMED